MIAFRVLVKVFMVLAEMNTAWVIKISQIHKMSGGLKQDHIKWTMLHFVVVTRTYFFSDHHLHGIIRKNGALSIKISQFHYSFTVCQLDLFSICFFGWHDSGFQATRLKVTDSLTLVLGNMILGKLSFVWVDLSPGEPPPQPISNIPVGIKTRVLQCWLQGPALRLICLKILLI